MNNMYDYKRIGERIKKERNDSGKSQEALGELLGVTRQTIAKWEHGKEMPHFEDCLNLCNLFGCDLGYLTCEYDCKTRATTDIQAEIGLSEPAINNLIECVKRPVCNALLSNMVSRTQALETFAKRYYAYITVFACMKPSIEANIETIRNNDNFKADITINGDKLPEVPLYKLQDYVKFEMMLAFDKLIEEMIGGLPSDTKKQQTRSARHRHDPQENCNTER